MQQHGEIYGREYGWDNRFEALVADIAAQFLHKFQPAWEKAWIAELNGERVGSVFVVRKSATTAQLRMLILSPKARGLGLGARLTDECIAFARGKGYKKMVLSTNSSSQLRVASTVSAVFGWSRPSPTKALVSNWWERPGS